MSNTVYEDVTNQIIKALESGNLPPWRLGTTQGHYRGMPVNAAGKAYSGINVLQLWATMSAKGYTSSQFITYKQALGQGGSVRKGEHGTQVVFYTPLTIKDKVTAEERKIPMLKYYTVFNTEQCDGLGSTEVLESLPVSEVDASVSQFVHSRGASIVHHDRASAYYNPTTDCITLPHTRLFNNLASYNSIALHELVHWSGSASRLDRDMTGKFGTEAYAMEELVAEMGSAMLCAQLGAENVVDVNHASYVGSWLKVLKGDNRVVASMATKASKAAKYLTEIPMCVSIVETTKVNVLSMSNILQHLGGELQCTTL